VDSFNYPSLRSRLGCRTTARINLLITNTRLGIVDGPELMRRTREVKPDLPILHVVHGNDPAGDTRPSVPTLHEAFTPNQLLLVIGSLMTG
jgi:hypothetical protein